MADTKPYNEILENVTLCFVKIAESGTKYKSEDREYSLNATVSKQAAKEFKKKFPKQSVKEFDNEEYETKYGISVPYPQQDEQYVIKLSKGHIRGGKEIDNKFRPQAYIVNEDSTLTCITTSRLIANGSVADVAYRVTTNEFGTFAHLEAIRITNLIEYKKSGALLNPFGGIISVVEEENKDVTEARKNKELLKEQQEVVPEDDEQDDDATDDISDDIPF